MVCKIKCVAITGIDTQPVTVETDVCNGLPTFDMVGLLASNIKESRERVKTAIKNSGFTIPPKRITINFSPANIKKTGTYFDLPVAISILISLGIIDCNVEDKMFIGELSLDGNVIRVNGVLPLVLSAMEQGIKKCYVPLENVGECDFFEEIEVVGISDLNQLVMALTTDTVPTKNHKIMNENQLFKYDFKNVKGQIQARRAAEISAAGMHNLLLVGSPGVGKSIIAKTMPSILPDMSLEEQIEISKIQSISGNLEGSLVSMRPVRSPHHTATVSAMIGGGINPKPGEITNAHGGVLFLDELPEYSRAVLETLRQPLEDEKVIVSRNGGTYTFPAKFILMGAMNPCKCGYYPDRNKCNCTEQDVKKYTEKISGPILDRMDLCVRMNNISYLQLNDMEEGEDSATIKERVDRAVDIQRKRYVDDEINFNSQLSGEKLKKYCELGQGQQQLMEQIYNKMELSVRAYEKVLKVSRTIADLKGHENIEVGDISEAVSFKMTKIV